MSVLKSGAGLACLMALVGIGCTDERSGSLLSGGLDGTPTGDEGSSKIPASGGGPIGTESGPVVIGPGGPEGGGAVPDLPAGVKAKDFYLTSVHPGLNGACGSCHSTGASSSPKFMDADAAASYAALDAAKLITSKDVSKLPNHGPHTGPALSDSLKTTVNTWLAAEVKERGIKTGGPSLDQIMSQFGSCITLAEFTAKPAGKSVDDLAQLQSDGKGRGPSGQCQACHSAGGSNYWSSNALGGVVVNHASNQKIPYLYKLVSATPNPDGTFAFSSAENRIKAKQVAAAACHEAKLLTCHPAIPGDITAYLTALQTMTASVAAKMAAGTCPPIPAAKQ